MPEFNPVVYRLNLKQLKNEFMRRIIRFETALKSEGINARLTSWTRTLRLQADLYAQGRTKPGKIVTYAPPGHSPHNFSLARDYAIFIGKTYVRDGTSPIYRDMADIATTCSLLSGYYFKKFRDSGHIEFPSWARHIREAHQMAEVPTA